MARLRIPFLTAFFVALTAVFCIALWLRLRSYEPDEPRAQRTPIQRSGDASSAPAIVPRKPITDIVPEEAPQQTRPGKSREVTIPVELAKPATRGAAVAAAERTQPPKPSLLSRIVTPIVNAIGGGGSRATASPVASSPQPATSRSGMTDTTATVDKDDRTSDTQPPQLLAISFNPPQVRDGEETVLTVQATDDLSGVRSISGTIVAPSNAVQGFALQREFETDRYVTRISVPKDAAEGVWRVNYLSLIDNASNAITLAGVQGALPATASFRVVSSRSDSTGPTLKGVWADKPAMRAGEKNTVFVDASDEGSGLQLVSGVFVSPSRHARIGILCHAGSAAWECVIAPPECLDCGDWHLEQIQLQDKANNITMVRGDNPIVANVLINITGDRCDSTPPTLQSIVLDRATVSNVDDSFITVTAVGTDDSCGIMSMSGQVTGPVTTARLFFAFSPAGDQWAGRISVPKLAAKGLWRITYLQVLDRGHNLRIYSTGDAALANATFIVQ